MSTLKCMVDDLETLNCKLEWMAVFVCLWIDVSLVIKWQQPGAAGKGPFLHNAANNISHLGNGTSNRKLMNADAVSSDTQAFYILYYLKD